MLARNCFQCKQKININPVLRYDPVNTTVSTKMSSGVSDRLGEIFQINMSQTLRIVHRQKNLTVAHEEQLLPLRQHSPFNNYVYEVTI